MAVIKPHGAGDIRMMQTPDLWPLGPVLALVNRERMDGPLPQVGVLVLHPDIKRTEVFLVNLHDDRLPRLLAGDPTNLSSIAFNDFEQIYDNGWRVD